MNKPEPIIYTLMVQCVRPEIGVMARYTAATPFPHLPAGAKLERRAEAVRKP